MNSIKDLIFRLRHVILVLGWAGVVIVWLIAPAPTDLVSAQAPSGWSKPVIISHDAPPLPGIPRDTTILATSDGSWHVFWDGTLDPARYGLSDILYYLRGSQSSWTRPLDVRYKTGGTALTLPAMAADTQGNLHALWTENFGDRLVYKRVPVLAIDSAFAFSSPQIVAEGNAINGRMTVDSAGNVYVVYATSGSNALNFTRLLKDSSTWSPVVTLPGTENQEGRLGGRYTQGIHAIATDGRNRIHVTWTVSMGGNYSGRSFYARSTDGGRNWSFPLRLDPTKGSQYGVDSVNIQTIGDDDIHLIWLSDALRRHQWSKDGGNTWTQPESFFGNVWGHGGLDQMAVDSAGVLHVVGIGLRESGIQTESVFHTTWSIKGWTTPELVALGLGIPDRHRFFERPSLAISSGNRLNVVWHDMENIWHSGKTIDAPYVPPAALPTLVPAQTAMPKTTPTPTTGTRDVPTDTPILQDTAASSATTSRGDPISPTLFGVVPVVLIVLVVFISRLWRSGQ